MDQENLLKSSLKAMVKSSFLVFFSIILSKILSYAYRIIIANNYGTEVYGLFSISLVVVSMVVAIASFGLHEGLLRYVSFYRGKKDFGKIKFIVNKSLKILLASSLASLVAIYYLSDIIAIKIFHSPSLIGYLKFIGLTIPLSAFAGALLAIIRAFEKVGTYSFLVNFLHNLLKVSILVLAILIGLGENSIIVSYILAYFLLLLVTYFFFVKYAKRIYSSEKDLSNSEKINVSKKLISYSWPVIFSSIFFSLFFWIDTIVLGSNLNAESVGVYSAAILLIGLFSFAQDLFIQLFVPLVSRNLAVGNKDVIKEVSKQIFKWVFIINACIALPLIIIPEKIIALFFRSEFLGSSTPLMILSIGAILSGFIGLLTGLINASGKTKRIFVYYIIFSAINFVLDISLVKNYGLNGVAAGTSLTWILFTSTLFIQAKKLYGFYPIRRTFAKVVVASLLSGFMLFILERNLIFDKLSTIIVLCIFLLVYLSLIMVLRTLDYRDMEIIKSLKDKIFTKRNNYNRNIKTNIS
jgi:O-antigen/teichoic acid export membrane protein